jgi:hypothetical protein
MNDKIDIEAIEKRNTVAKADLTAEYECGSYISTHGYATTKNSLADIPALLAEVKRLTAERDAAVEDLKTYGRNIHTCRLGKSCNEISAGHDRCYACDGWQWRGVQPKEEHHA